VDPSRETYPSTGVRIGVDLIDTGGTPYVGDFTGVDSGAVPPSPPFVWSRYDHDPQDLPPGTYNVGVACVHDQHVVRYWNVRFTFVASVRDPGGFTWTAADPVPASSGSSDGPAVAGAAVVAVLIGAGGVVWWRRRAARAVAGRPRQG
jgi:hypothetical protein